MLYFIFYDIDPKTLASFVHLLRSTPPPLLIYLFRWGNRFRCGHQTRCTFCLAVPLAMPLKQDFLAISILNFDLSRLKIQMSHLTIQGVM